MVYQLCLTIISFTACICMDRKHVGEVLCFRQSFDATIDGRHEDVS
jgi:hypothetical protein